MNGPEHRQAHVQAGLRDLALTGAGADLVGTSTATIADSLSQVYGPISDEDLATAGRAIAAVNAAIESELALA